MTWAAAERITGAPPATDPAPNGTTEPVITRIIRSPRARAVGGRPKACLWAEAGTSIPVSVYVRVTGVNGGVSTWVLLASAITVTTGTMSYIDVPPEADLYFRNAAPTGGVTARGVAFM